MCKCKCNVVQLRAKSWIEWKNKIKQWSIDGWRYFPILKYISFLFGHVHRNKFRCSYWAGKLSFASYLRGLWYFHFFFFYVIVRRSFDCRKINLWLIAVSSSSWHTLDIPWYDSWYTFRKKKKEKRKKKNWRRKCCVWIFLGRCFLSQQNCFGFLWFNAVHVCVCSWCSEWSRSFVSFESVFFFVCLFLRNM